MGLSALMPQGQQLVTWESEAQPTSHQKSTVQRVCGPILGRERSRLQAPAGPALQKLWHHACRLILPQGAFTLTCPIPPSTSCQPWDAKCPAKP